MWIIKRIEEQTGNKLTDMEFLCGIREARRDSLNHKAEIYRNNSQNAKIVNIPKCPTCQSANINKVSVMSKAGSVVLGSIFTKSKETMAL